MWIRNISICQFPDPPASRLRRPIGIAVRLADGNNRRPWLGDDDKCRVHATEAVRRLGATLTIFVAKTKRPRYFIAKRLYVPRVARRKTYTVGGQKCFRKLFVSVVIRLAFRRVFDVPHFFFLHLLVALDDCTILRIVISAPPFFAIPLYTL